MWCPWAALDAASPGGDECLEEDEEELEAGLDDAEQDGAGKAAGSGRGCLLTRRGITLRVLLKDGLIEPGEGLLSIYYLVRAPRQRAGSVPAVPPALPLHPASRLEARH